jgi:hypothetical protein
MKPLMLFLTLVLFSGCSLIDDYYDVEIHLVERSPWEYECRIEGPYLLRYLSADMEIIERYLTSQTSAVTVSLSKGMPLVAAAYPFGAYAPLGCLFDPKHAGPGQLRAKLSSREGPIADAFITYKKEFGPILTEVDLGQISDTIWTVTERRPWLTDWGSLYRDLSFDPQKTAPVSLFRSFEVDVRFPGAGWWICDTRGIDPVLLSCEQEITFLLPPGFYTFYCPNGDYSLQCLTVYEDGSSLLETERVPFQLQ